MIIRLKLFALARQLACADELELELPDRTTVSDVRRALVERVPDLAPLGKHLLFAVNAEYALDATPIPPGAELACIPPVSGG